MDQYTKQKMQQYGIKLQKRVDGTKIIEGNSYLAGYIDMWGVLATPDDIQEFIDVLQKCVDGQFDYDFEDVTAYSIHTFHTELKPQGLRFYKKLPNGTVQTMNTYPHEDIRVLLNAWRDFLING